jgi:protein-tyrosine phosphatase
MDFSHITENLLIGTTPAPHDYEQLRELSVKLVINMRVEQGPFPDPHDPPLDFLWLRTFDTMFVPIPIGALIRGTQAALKVIESGSRVYVHCAAGRHRSVALGAAILIAQGHAPQPAMQLIKSKRSFADPEIFYIRWRILKFAAEWARQKEFGSL